MFAITRRSFVRTAAAGTATVAWNNQLFAAGEKPAGPWDVVAVRHGGAVAMFEAGIKALGGIGKFVQKGQKVLVKPNLGWDKPPAIPANINRTKVALVEERQRSLRSARSSINRRVAEAGAPAQGDVLNGRISISDVRSELWKARHAFVNATDTTDRLREQKVLEDYLARPAMWKTLVESRQSTVRAAIFDLDGQSKDTTTAGDLELLTEYRAIETLLQKAVEEAKELENLPAIWGLREDVARSKKGFDGWLAAAWVWTTDTAKSLLNLELYTVPETVMVDGRSVTGGRAITLGKVLILLGIVSADYLLLRTFATRVARKIQNRFRLESGKDLTIRRWILSPGMLGLAIYAMHYARISLTAFAFLGGELWPLAWVSGPRTS